MNRREFLKGITAALVAVGLAKPKDVEATEEYPQLDEAIQGSADRAGSVIIGPSIETFTRRFIAGEEIKVGQKVFVETSYGIIVYAQPTQFTRYAAEGIAIQDTPRGGYVDVLIQGFSA